MPETQRHNVVDPIAALVAIRHQIRSGALRRHDGRIAVPVYDGSRRFDLESRRGEHGKDGVLRLEMVLRPIAGFKGEASDDDGHPDEAPRAIRFHLTDDERLIPLRIEVSIAYFTTVAAIDHLRTAATPCAVTFEPAASVGSSGG